ncbi:MAG: hypothetical protein HUJ25_01845 [Crocinitomicaceae bacterium]|nr:hypothetical protein [Crocinitomicaceae bacterium]
MAEENKHMDDAFKRMGEEFKVKYNPEFWEDAKSKLDDASLDDAFKAAALNAAEVPALDPTSVSESVDDMFMDSAFVEASSEQSANYDSKFFQEFLEKEGDIAMDEAFVEASGATVVDYLPEYWEDADKALKNEGLHYEYSTEYWKEARRLLDREDRKVFFTRWSAAAAILMLISFSGQFLNPVSDFEVEAMQANVQGTTEYENIYLSNSDVESAKNALLADKEFADYTNLADAFGATNNAHNDAHTNDVATNENNENISVDHLTNSVDNETTIVTSTGSENVKTDESTFNSKKLEGDLAINNKLEDELTLMDIDKRYKPEIHQIGYSKFAPQIKIEKTPPMTMHSVGVLAQSGIGNKWGNFSFMPTLRNSVGIEYIVSSGKRFQNFEFGGSFMINHIRQSRLNTEDRSTVYDVNGNVTKYWRKVQLKDMVFANLNGLVNYRVAPDHKVKFGLGMEYLVGVRSNMSYVDDFTNEIKTVNNNWGVKEGLKKFDIRLTVGYEYEISNRFTLQVNSNLGLFDRTDNTFLKDEQTDREINVMLGLKYNFIKMKKK